MISVHSYHVTVELLYLTVAGMAKTRMRNKMCNCASRLIEHSSEQTIICIRGLISFIAKFIPFLAVFNQLMLCGTLKKFRDLHTQLKCLSREHFIVVIKALERLLMCSVLTIHCLHYVVKK